MKNTTPCYAHSYGFCMQQGNKIILSHVFFKIYIWNSDCFCLVVAGFILHKIKWGRDNNDMLCRDECQL